MMMMMRRLGAAGLRGASCPRSSAPRAAVASPVQGHTDRRQAGSAHHEAGPPEPGVAATVRRVSRLLPTQPVMEKFVHHNPLHALESMTFDEAVAYMHEQEK
jgi:hypothetical protein